MSTIEIKSEIVKVIDTLPEDALLPVLNYLKSVSTAGNDKTGLSANLRRILEEDKELLQKLAQ